jgi:hypothetical protein
VAISRRGFSRQRINQFWLPFLPLAQFNKVCRLDGPGGDGWRRARRRNKDWTGKTTPVLWNFAHWSAEMAGGGECFSPLLCPQPLSQ